MSRNKPKTQTVQPQATSRFLKMVSVYDIKAQAFLSPQTVRTTAEGCRLFENACADQNSNFFRFPSDFVLYELAEWDELTGSIYPYEKPQTLATASDYVPQKQ